ncbi:hypothetical protein [Pseudoalteromonas nigrifaciens]|uniref:hypothetical protein n=1 Tax=Pseudoalteromonas nigrifaciens TaxID=28109 RepID=UPI003FD592E0
MAKLTEKQKQLLEQANILASEANKGCINSKGALLKMFNKHPLIKNYLLKKLANKSRKSNWKHVKKHNRKNDATFAPGVMTGLLGHTSARTWQNTK